MQNVIGVKLTDDLAERVRLIGERWGLRTAGGARELLLLGLSMVESLEQKGVPMPFLNLTEACRRPLSQTTHEIEPNEPIAPNEKPDPLSFGLVNTGSASRLPGADLPAAQKIGPTNQLRKTEVDDAADDSPDRRRKTAAAANGSGSADP